MSVAEQAAGQVALVTGAGTGIGKAVAHALLKDGWRVVFAGRRAEVLENAIREAGATAETARRLVDGGCEGLDETMAKGDSFLCGRALRWTGLCKAPRAPS